jgi:general secretion pathway protein C
MTSSGLRWLTLAVWAVVGASAVAWGLRVFPTAPGVPPGATAVVAGSALQGDPLRLLGAAAPSDAAPAPALPPASSRFTLLGVVAPRAPAAAGEGLAVIAVDDRPPRAYRVGATVDGELVVRRVHARGVELGPADGGAAFALDAPPLAPAAAAPARPLPGQPLPRVLPQLQPRALPLPPQPVVDGDMGSDGSETSEDVEPALPEAVPTSRLGLETR